MENIDILYRFQTISYLCFGIFFSITGLLGFKQLAGGGGFPGITLIFFTALLTSFGVWSLRKFYGRYRTAKLF